MSEPFIAEIRIFAGSFAPRSWAFCDGQLLPISQNTALFSLIGTTYGGDGRTTTALPNMQGRVPMHAGRGPGLTSRRIGQRGGAEQVTLSEAQMPQHQHTQLAVPRGQLTVGNSLDPAGNLLASPQTGNQYADANNLVDMASNSLTNAGGSQPHNNLQPFLVMNFIIALQGLYPSRS
ncbi:MAG: tail fiber protein [Pseudomonadota bacterium]